MTAAELSPKLRQLIDARLEAIDQALQRARVSWSERRNIVGEVETQIFELLSRRSEVPTAEDVADVLGTLDPPEAFVPESAECAYAESRSEVRELAGEGVEIIKRSIPGATAVLTLVVVNGAIVALAIASDGFLPWLITLGALGWLNYAGVRWLRAWNATRDGNLIDEACRGLGHWLLSKSGAPAT